MVGGAAGPGKTELLLMESLRQIGHPAYRAILFRRIFPSLEAADGLIDRSLRWFPGYGGRYNASKHYWIFPSGARIYFGHMQYRDTVHQYKSAQYQYIGFDELTEFEEFQYLYLFSRLRAPVDSGLRCYMRSGTNPGGVGHNWVKRRFITRDIVNKKRWFARIDDEDAEVDKTHPDAKSRAFYPALFGDNPAIGEDYVKNLKAMADPVEKARLLEGDWDADYREGLVYGNWSVQQNVSAEAEYKEGIPVIWGVDDGYVYGDGPGTASYHPRIILFLQQNELGGYNVFDELAVTGETHQQTIDAALDMPYAAPHVAYVDGSAAMFRGELGKRGIQTVNGTHKVVEGIKYVRQLICDGNGVRVLRVHPRVSNLIYEMGEYRNDPKLKAQTGELVPMKLSDHSQDALRYVLYKRRFM